MKYKYPRTMHLPWSQKTTGDDRFLQSIDFFKKQDVVVTEKLDGEATTGYSDGHIHARSITGKHHPSQSWVKNMLSDRLYNLPAGWRVCGENMTAKHTMNYNKLDSFFFVYFVFNEDNIALSWDETVSVCEMLNILTVPVLYRGKWDTKRIQQCYTGKSLLNGEQEGYVVRTAKQFLFKDFAKYVAKFVRHDFAKTLTKRSNKDQHWKQGVFKQNELKSNS